MKSKNTILCFLVAAITISLGAYFEFTHYRIGIYTPHSWGMIKGLLDPILIITFPWGGWIFLIPLLVALWFRLSMRTIFFLWIVTTLVMVIADSIISFHEISFIRLIKGVCIYTFIFGPFLILAILTNFLLMKKNES